MKDSDSESPPQAARAAQAAPAVPVATTEAAPAVVALRQRAEAKQRVCVKICQSYTFITCEMIDVMSSWWLFMSWKAST